MVRYDDVIERPAEILARITDRLAIGSGEADQDQLNRSIMQAGSFPRTTYKDRVVPEAVLKLRDELAATYAAVYATHGV